MSFADWTRTVPESKVAATPATDRDGNTDIVATVAAPRPIQGTQFILVTVTVSVFAVPPNVITNLAEEIW